MAVDLFSSVKDRSRHRGDEEPDIEEFATHEMMAVERKDGRVFIVFR